MEFKYENNRLLGFINKEEVGYVEYNITNGELDILHTVVYENFAGKGLAKLLMEETRKIAKENNLKIIATCSYAEKYFNIH